MHLTLTDEEASLTRYALRELARKRYEQALEGKRTNSEWAAANHNEALKLEAIANRITKEERRMP